MNEPKLTVQIGYSSLQGRREDNQDFAAFAQPTGQDLNLHGIVAAVADGMGGANGGRVAAETCIRSFLDGYYQSAATLGVERKVARSLDAVNSWIHEMGKADAELAGMATTFTALILQGRQAYGVHLGDSRLYRLRGEKLEKLTEDHTLKHPDLNHVLYRAVGIEARLRVEVSTLGMECHDRFLLCTDGLYSNLRESDIRAVLLERSAPETSAQTLTELALAKGSLDNITALVVDVISLPLPNRDFLLGQIVSLPVQELPRVGDLVDGYRLDRLLSKGRYSSLFVASDSTDGKPVVLKFPNPDEVSLAEYHEAFLREAWIGSRVHSPWVAEIIEPAPGNQTRLYSVMPFYKGLTLEEKIQQHSPIRLEEGVQIGLKLCKALHALHRLRIIHRDIKPENVLIMDDGGLRLLDLGVARLPAFAEDPNAPIPGTASYLGPEQFKGERGSELSDQFAVGVTLYRLFAQGAYPYGEIEPFSTPRYQGKRKPLSHYRPDLPGWLDVVLAKSLAVEPKDRYGDIMELAYELEVGLDKGGQVLQVKQPWYQRNPLLFWKTLSALLLFALLVSLGFNAHSSPSVLGVRNLFRITSEKLIIEPAIKFIEKPLFATKPNVPSYRHGLPVSRLHGCFEARHPWHLDSGIPCRNDDLIDIG